MTIIIDSVMTPYEIVRYNEINKVLKGSLEVWFLKKSEKNRLWKYFPPVNFRYKILSNNLQIIALLSAYKDKIKRIVCCGWNSSVYLYSLVYCRINHLRYTLWSGSTVYERSWWRTLFNPLVKLIVHKTDDYIVYGTRAKEYLIRLGAPRDKIKTFLNSVDVDFFQKKAQEFKKLKLELREKYKISQKDKVILFVGQLIERKGVRELLDGFYEVSKIEEKLTLLLVGEGELKNEIKTYIYNHKNVKIKLLGFIEYDKLPEIYALSDVLVLPSKEEVWGLVVNEALASGLPVLVSQFAGCSCDLVNRDSGEIIEKISQDNITAILQKFLVRKKYIISSQLIRKMKNTTYAINGLHD